MKKAWFLAIFLLAFLGLSVFSALPASAAGEKIGYVDLARVFDEYQKTKAFDKSLEIKGAQKQTERDKMVNEVKRLRDEAELLGAKAKDEKQAAIDEKIKALQDFDRNARDTLRKERDSMVRDILKEIETVIQDFGKSQGYSFVFNDRVLVYKSEGGDLTNSIIKALNDSYAKKR